MRACVRACVRACGLDTKWARGFLLAGEVPGKHIYFVDIKKIKQMLHATQGAAQGNDNNSRCRV